jgi:thiamine biosynthesis protein ThiC
MVIHNTKRSLVSYHCSERSSSNSFYEELEHVFDICPKYHMKILIGNFNAKVGRGDIFKPIVGNES